MMPWIDHVDRVGMRADAAYEQWIEKHLAPMITTAVVAVIEIVCPIVGLVAAGYLVLG